MPQETQRVAIVTGAGRGIGVAIRLAADGFAVGVLDLDEGLCADTVREIEAAGGRAMAVGADVSNTGQVEAAVATAARVKMSFGDFKKAAAERIPVRRMGVPEDVAHTVSYLVSEGAGYVSGQVVYVAGGPLC